MIDTDHETRSEDARPRHQSVPVRFAPDELERLDGLVTLYGAASRGHLVRMAVEGLAGRGGASRDQLIRSAMDSLRAALALPEGAAPGAAEEPPPPPPACVWDAGGGPCGAPAEYAVEAGAELVPLCGRCLGLAGENDRRFRRNRRRRIGAGAVEDAGSGRGRAEAREDAQEPAREATPARQAGDAATPEPKGRRSWAG